MWLVAMFDLPVTTKSARKAYAEFRRTLLERGFTMLQYSVYARYCVSEEASETHRRYLSRTLPSEGQVRFMAITDHQFGKMEVYFGKKRATTEQPPDQMLLF
ncbi:CRISPR-associated endoribonuclease Cas2 [Aeoliella mucimassa]|uniref:CRISPR-associated endoribonuclease Cas2 n=2 Tax=Aeoliella mucimassa TaxID=2527972 RepID=A0A518APU5_9BACT|nr:CRISPR-associated endoribonuclease Cas2 [Aeoliella mucimassa]